MDCPDLRALFGSRYRVRREPGSGLTPDPWYQQIPCRRGHICPWGPDLLAACTDRPRPQTVRALLEIPGAELVQEGSDGCNVTFPVEHFERVAEIMEARRRPQYTAEQLDRLRERAALARASIRPANERGAPDPTQTAC